MEFVAAPRLEEVGPISSLIPALARTHRTLALSLLREVGLVPGQEVLLAHLWDEQPRSQVELAELLCVEPPTAAKMLARMEAVGVITREKSAPDRRVTLVSLTDKGRALLEPVQEIWAELERVTTTGLTEDEKALLSDLLSRMTGNIDAQRHSVAGA
ncbi:MarR family winged helix-turn-helix transcriptional regulator [Streptomyces sp. NPDC057565]|uniref:MarR family winged helix-turn-helix transcriptional regulator n=1 Tax=Streptomyces sp. NPDC057565 TaxID=3346169 RepID=UPI0036A9E7BB